MRILKKSTVANVMIFFTSELDHITGLAGATPVILISKDGGAFNSISPVVTDRGYGWYNIELTGTHTNTDGDLVLHATAIGADPTDLVMFIMEQVPQDIFNVVDELHKIQGLDISNPMTVTPTTRDAGSIHLDITGDGETTTTVTRA